MIFFCIVIFSVLVLFIAIPLAKNNEKWIYRNICGLLRWMRKKGWNIPKWVDGKFIFQSWLLMFLGSFALLFCASWLRMETITKLEKPKNGEGSVWEDVEITWEDEDGKKYTEQFQVEVKEQMMKQDEVEKQISEIKVILEETILGDNKSFDFVNKPLCMPEKIENYSAEIVWDSDCPWIMNWEGKLGADIPEEGVLVNLTATISLQNQEESLKIAVTVFPEEYNWLEDLKNTINEMESESSWLELPDMWNGVKVKWKKDKDTLLIFLSILVLSTPLLLFFKKKQQLEEIEKLERQQMLQDYPEIISKLILLLSAGMSLRRAIEKIVSDYKMYDKKHEHRKAYEMLADICKEMKCGVTEKQAYENFGEKCDLLQYRTLSALLVQHLQKGNKGMEQMLTEEVRRAQELRQQQAKILGEQASAKLLFPMTLMLLDVFIILLVPAWISFSI